MNEYRKELGWAITAIMLLIGAVSWFFTSTLMDIQAQNKSQWQHAAQTKDCFMRDLAKLGERVAFIEGKHAEEKR